MDRRTFLKAISALGLPAAILPNLAPAGMLDSVVEPMDYIVPSSALLPPGDAYVIRAQFFSNTARSIFALREDDKHIMYFHAPVANQPVSVETLFSFSGIPRLDLSKRLTLNDLEPREGEDQSAVVVLTLAQADSRRELTTSRLITSPLQQRIITT